MEIRDQLIFINSAESLAPRDFSSQQICMELKHKKTIGPLANYDNYDLATWKKTIESWVCGLKCGD